MSYAKVKQAVLRAKFGTKHISSDVDQREVAFLRYAKESMEAQPDVSHGILALLTDQIHEAKDRIKASEASYEVDWVQTRKPKISPPAGVYETFGLLVDAFLNQCGPKPHDQSRSSFWVWFKMGTNSQNPSNIVRRLIDRTPAGDSIKKMGKRVLMDCYQLIKNSPKRKNVQR